MFLLTPNEWNYFMKKLNLLLTICLSIIVVGCASAPKVALYTSTPEVKPGKAQVIVYSHPKINAYAPSAMIIDNDQNVGTLISGQFLIYNTKPGKHKVWGDSALIDSPLETTFEEGKTYYFRYISKYIPYASRTWLKPIEESVATAELATCCTDGVEKSK